MLTFLAVAGLVASVAGWDRAATLVFALLVAGLGDDDFRVREWSEWGLRQARPEADGVLRAAVSSPNPEVSVRADRALRGLPPRVAARMQAALGKGFRFQYNNYTVRVCEVRDGWQFWVECVYFDYRFDQPLTRAEIMRVIATTPQPASVWRQR